MYFDNDDDSFCTYIYKLNLSNSFIYSVITFKLTTDPTIPESILPTRGSTESAGWDLYATSSIILERSAMIDTGIRIVELPENTYMRIAARSGLASKHNIQVLGGVIDRDYKGNIKVILINHGTEPYEITRGDRIAQFILEKYDTSEYEVVENVKRRKLEEDTDSSRGSGGFVSTGK